MRSRIIHLYEDYVEVRHVFVDVRKQLLRDYLVEHVPVHLTVLVVHVPSFVKLAVSLRNLSSRAAIHSYSTVEVAARSREGA